MELDGLGRVGGSWKGLVVSEDGEVPAEGSVVLGGWRALLALLRRLQVYYHGHISEDLGRAHRSSGLV